VPARWQRALSKLLVVHQRRTNWFTHRHPGPYQHDEWRACRGGAASNGSMRPAPTLSRPRWAMHYPYITLH